MQTENTASAAPDLAVLAGGQNLPPDELRKSVRASHNGHSAEHLTITAKSNPWRLFTGLELAVILNRAYRVVLKTKTLGAKFNQRKSRPEWITEWLDSHPHFTVKCNGPCADQCADCSQAVREPRKKHGSVNGSDHPPTTTSPPPP